MPYVLISTDTAEEFNRALWKLMRPDSKRTSSDVTEFYARLLTHPTNGRCALELPDVEESQIDKDATSAELVAVLRTLVDKGSLRSEEIDAIEAAIEVKKDSKVIIASFIPPSWSKNVLTEEQVKADGWFPSKGD